MPDPEIIAPADEPLTTLEETVLLVLARGEALAPIGRYGEVLAELAARGLAKRLDEMNYAVTERGKAVAEAKNDQFVRGWIADSNRAVLARRGNFSEPGLIDSADHAPRLTGTTVNETFLNDASVDRAGQVDALLRDIIETANRRFDNFDALMYEVGRWHHVAKKLLETKP